MKYLITGGTGTLGQALVDALLKNDTTTGIIVYSRDEFKQSEMARKIKDERMEYWLGDVRDLERLKEAVSDTSVIIHTAAMKRMDSTSHNAWTLADVNITGTRNVMLASAGRPTVVVSSDKAYSPSCVYGASKLVAESIALAHHNSIVWRFGNFRNSRGSVWQIFKEQAESGGILTITDPKATRFVLDIEEVVEYILKSIKVFPESQGLNWPTDVKSMTVLEIAEEVAPDCAYEIIGLREGEKMHEAFDENFTSEKI